MAEIVAGWAGLPVADLHAVLGGRRAMVLAPHPDDESIGCGGLIAAACAAGIAPLVVILTDGAASHPGSVAFPPARLAGIRQAETRDAVAALGLPAENIVFLGYPDTGLPRAGEGFAAAVARLCGLGDGVGVVVGPWGGDPHCDHEAAALLAAAAARHLGVCLLSYPVWGWLRDGEALVEEARMTGWRLDVAAHLPAKRRAIAAHRSQHGQKVADAPDGFVLPDALLAVAMRPYEVFIA